MKKKFTVILLTLLMAALTSVSVMGVVFAAPVTGTETDRTKIGAFHSAWGSLPWMSGITAAYVAEYERLESMGFNPGTVMDPVEQWEIGFKQEYKDGDGAYEAGHTGRSLILFYNALADKAFSMYNDPYEVWMTDANKDTLLMPTSNQATIGTDVYQNFSGGYTKNKTLIAGKNIRSIETATTEDAYDLTPAQKFCQTYSGDIWNNLGAKTLHQVVKSMSDAVVALEDTGFNVGTVSKDGAKAWATAQDSGTIVIADMSRSDSNTFIWGESDGRNAMVMYNANTGSSHIIYDEIAKKYIEFKLTTPKSDMFILEEVKYQNFTNGYIKVVGGAAEFVMNKNFDKDTKTEISAFDVTDTGAFDAASTVAQATKDAVSAAIAATATEKELGAPVNFVVDNGFGVFSQSFEDCAIFVRVSGEDVLTTEAIFLDGEIYSAYNTKFGFYVPEDEMGASSAIRLGNPKAAPFTVENKTYVNFDRGCIVFDGTTAEVKTGFKANADGSIADLVFDSVSFIGSSYTKPANVTLTNEQIVAKFNAKYESLMTAGYNLGAPDDGGISLWTKADYVAGSELKMGDGIIKQGFIGGDSEGFTFGVNAYLVYNISKDEVYVIRDYVQSQMQYILFAKGAPTADTIVTGNTMKQQFEAGYINASKTWGAFMFYDGMQIGDKIEEEEEEEEDVKPDNCAGCGTIFTNGITGGTIGLIAVLLGTLVLFAVRPSKRKDVK